MPTPGGSRGFWPGWLTPRRATEFIINVIRLESAMEQVQRESVELRSDLTKLQRQVAEQDAKVQVLVDFVKQALTERIDTRTELAVRRLLDGRSGEPPKLP